jgi:hypothetical protein
MKTILLTQNKVALVDDMDFPELSKYKWFTQKMGKYYYAARNEDGFTKSMHRQILGLGRGDGRQGDHINHNTLDNRRGNLRICTKQNNLTNQACQKNRVSIFKGVSRRRGSKRWESYIKVNGKKIHLGYYSLEELAALAYDFAALRYHRNFVYFNF